MHSPNIHNAPDNAFSKYSMKNNARTTQVLFEGRQLPICGILLPQINKYLDYADYCMHMSY